MLIRKTQVIIEEINMENGMKLVQPAKKVAAMAILKNPYAKGYKEDLSLLYDYGEQLGGMLSKMAVDALNIKQDEIKDTIDSYGKGVIVGSAGEVEHAHAIMHPKLGKPFREVLGGPETCPAIMPSTAKVGSMGVAIDIPLHYKLSEWVVTHFDTMTINVSDGPRYDEILVAIAISTCGRPLARTVGLHKKDI